jgi:hypothetical protein
MHSIPHWECSLSNSQIFKKNWKTKYPLDVDKKRFDDVMHTRKVVIKNAFESLKNRWHILTHFNFRVNQVVPIKVACCVFHN